MDRRGHQTAVHVEQHDRVHDRILASGGAQALRHAAIHSVHAAITRSLNSWSNYKSWTDKVRSNWDKDKGGK